MTSIAHSKNINKFITDFLSEHGSEELAEMWNEDDNMKAFTALLVKAANAVKRSSSDKKIKDPLKPKGKKSAYRQRWQGNRRDQAPRNLVERAQGRRRS